MELCPRFSFSTQALINALISNFFIFQNKNCGPNEGSGVIDRLKNFIYIQPVDGLEFRKKLISFQI